MSKKVAIVIARSNQNGGLLNPYSVSVPCNFRIHCQPEVVFSRNQVISPCGMYRISQKKGARK